VAACLEPAGVVRQEEDVAWTVDDLIELMNLGAFRDKFVRELSTGLAPDRRPGDVHRARPEGAAARRAVSGIAQKETEALGRCCSASRTRPGARCS
jgi:branched-chain amino acid transport system ATP-binding protein